MTPQARRASSEARLAAAFERLTAAEPADPADGEPRRVSVSALCREAGMTRAAVYRNHRAYVDRIVNLKVERATTSRTSHASRSGSRARELATLRDRVERLLLENSALSESGGSQLPARHGAPGRRAGARGHAHALRFDAGDDAALAEDVGHFLLEAARRGRALLLVATPAHRAPVLAAFERLALCDRRATASPLVVLDSHEMLASFMDGDRPDAARFERSVGSIVRAIDHHMRPRGLCAFGDMVSVLWSEHRPAAAIALERLWNRLLNEVSASLYCTYPIDLLDQDVNVDDLDALLRAHSTFAPAHDALRLERALVYAAADLDVRDVDGAPVELVRDHPAWPALPPAEATLLWLHEHRAPEAEAMLRKASRYYRAS